MTKSAQKLKELRHKKGETLVEVATAVGVTPSAICQYETGQRVPGDKVKMALAKHYNRSVQFLFFSE